MNFHLYRLYRLYCCNLCCILIISIKLAKYGMIRTSHAGIKRVFVQHIMFNLFNANGKWKIKSDRDRIAFTGDDWIYDLRIRGKFIDFHSQQSCLTYHHRQNDADRAEESQLSLQLDFPDRLLLACHFFHMSRTGREIRARSTLNTPPTLSTVIQNSMTHRMDGWPVQRWWWRRRR